MHAPPLTLCHTPLEDAQAPLLLSVLGGVALNMVLAVNHRPGRDLGM